MIHKPLFTLAILAAAFTPGAANAVEQVRLVPFKTSLRFAPHQPQTVAADHPLSGKVALDAVSNMPSNVGLFMNRFVSAKEMNRALGETLVEAGMRSGAEQAAPFRLSVTWLEFNSPFKISIKSKATATLRYELRRTDSGAVIFQRDITTHAEASGGDGSYRARGTARAALAANLAGAIRCMDLAAYGQAPADCALSPTGMISAPITTYVPIYRYR